MVDLVCACTDAGCVETALMALGRVFATALTPDDMKIVRDATARASACASKISAAAK
jgi:hypothetical protein